MSKEPEKKFTPSYYNDQVWLRLQAIEWNNVDKLDPARIADYRAAELFDAFLKSYAKLARYIIYDGGKYDDARRLGEMDQE